MTLVSQAEWARKQGFSKQYASQLVKNGVIPLTQGKINEKEADSILAGKKESTYVERRKYPTAHQELSTLLLKTRIKNEIEKGKILEAKAKIEAGAVISIETVKQSAFNKARIVRDSLLNIPDRVASLLANTEDPHTVHAILTREIRTALEELSRDV